MRLLVSACLLAVARAQSGGASALGNLLIFTTTKIKNYLQHNFFLKLSLSEVGYIFGSKIEIDYLVDQSSRDLL